MPPGNVIIRVLNNPPQDLMLELVLLNVAGSGMTEAVQLKNSQQVHLEMLLNTSITICSEQSLT